MTDRELLMYAAKAAGYRLDTHDYGPDVVVIERGGRWREFDPINDDGDALRLAIKLRMDLFYTLDNDFVLVAVPPLGDRQRVHVEEEVLGDAYAGVRRAIVRAAAEIGRGDG